MTEIAQLRAKAGRRVQGANAEDVLRMGPGGELVNLPWHIATALEGRLHIVNFGKDTTPLNFAKTAYDEDQPQCVLRVPSGYAVVPVSIVTYLETTAGTINEVIYGTCQNDIGAGTSSAATLGPINLRGDQPRTSGCTPLQLYTANSAALTNKSEFYRGGYAFADAANDPIKRFEWNILQSPVIPVVRHPSNGASLIVWIDGTTTAPTGFVEMVYAEFDINDLAAA